MKCKYCGGEVGLEEKYCTYCGRPNEQALRHSQDMASYRRRFAATEADVVNKTERYRRIVLRAVLILLLLIATVAMYVVTENAYSIPETTRRRAAEKNPERTISELDSYLEKGDYSGFSSYMEYHGIRTYGTACERYSHVNWCAQQYSDFVLRMERLFLYGDREDWLKYSASGDIRALCQSLEYFLDDYKQAERDAETDRYMVYIEDMRQEITEMLHVYLGIDESELDGFLALSDNRKAAAIEGVLLDAQDKN